VSGQCLSRRRSNKCMPAQQIRRCRHNGHRRIVPQQTKEVRHGIAVSRMGQRIRHFGQNPLGRDHPATQRLGQPPHARVRRILAVEPGQKIIRVGENQIRARGWPCR